MSGQNIGHPMITCTCKNGIAATYPECISNGANICKSCDTGFDKSGTNCEGKLYYSNRQVSKIFWKDFTFKGIHIKS